MQISHSIQTWGPALGVASVALFVLYALWLRWGARIHSREARFEMREPFYLVGRTDLIMQQWGGELVIHDLKTRKSARIYPSDKLQLALYALLVRASTGRRVASYAVIRIAMQGRSHELRHVELNIPDNELIMLYEKFCAKAASPMAARMTAAPYMCRQCGFNGRGCQGKNTSKK